jgi:hypothetical protein
MRDSLSRSRLGFEMVRREATDARPAPDSKGPDDRTSSADEALGRCFEAGRAAWPQISLELEAFERYFASHATNPPPDRAHATDMYLACACANGDDSALDALDKLLAADVAVAVAKPSRLVALRRGPRVACAGLQSHAARSRLPSLHVGAKAAAVAATAAAQAAYALSAGQRGAKLAGRKSRPRRL